jgi:hypothetical protein
MSSEEEYQAARNQRREHIQKLAASARWEMPSTTEPQEQYPTRLRNPRNDMEAKHTTGFRTSKWAVLLELLLTPISIPCCFVVDGVRGVVKRSEGYPDFIKRNWIGSSWTWRKP